MIERRLMRQLERVAGRVRHRRTVLGWIGVWLIVALLACLYLGGNQLWGWYLPNAVPVLGFGGLAAVVVTTWWSQLSSRDYRLVAQRVEAEYPELQASLLAAIEQRPRVPGGRFDFMQHCVIEDSLRHAYRHAWLKVAPPWQLMIAHCGHLVALICFVAALSSLWLWTAAPQTLAEVDDAGTAELVRTVGEFDVTVAPGNHEIERGTSLLVTARFGGPLPPEAKLVFTTAAGENGAITMSKSLDDPIFGGRISDVTEDLFYRVEFADQQTEEYQATVFEYPRLVRADAKLVYPEYTSQPEQLVHDKRNLSVVEGTELTLLCRLNKVVSEATLVDRQDNRMQLTAGDTEPTVYAWTTKLTQSLRLRLHLVDAEGRSNKHAPQFVINVLPNKPPDLKLVRPSRDVQVSPLEELQLEANAWDDYGINRLGVSFMMGGKEPRELVLGDSISGKSRTQVAHLVALEELDAEPDQLLAYHFWAEDTAADGTSRRTSSDMFFAEVRHFEEIFRQGQQPPGGASSQQRQQQMGGGGAASAAQLGDLQKEIMNATWTIIRRETATQPSEAFAKDIALVLESQATALQQVEALAERVSDEQSMGHVEAIRKHMLEAIALLARSQKGPDLKSLSPAMSSEQSAYQAILKLRAREHEVTRSRQPSNRSSGGGSSNRSQQQLQQLELSQDENRYETQRTADATEETGAERENRQILSRLRELARRQSDLNERLKELQAALQAAETEQEQEDLKRQLKRLQEEQEQILRDTDELESRMEQPQNQEDMSSERQQLERTRQNVQRASEALEQGQVSRAVSSGTRAEREFEQLREEFRRRTSGQFSEEMREIRQQVQQLDETEQELSQQLDELTQPQPQSGSLRETGNREQIEEGLRQQKDTLNELLERMRQTVEQAETAEPLLAEQLYDAARKAMQEELDQSLEAAARSVSRGFLDNAQHEEREASEGIRELRAGVERAASSVLGDEAEALRRARDELEQLRRQLEDEVTRNTPSSRADEQSDSPGEQSNESDQTEAADDALSRASDQEQPASESSAERQNPAQNPSTQSESQPSSSEANSTEPGGPTRSQEQTRSQSAQENQQQRGASGNESGEAQPGGRRRPQRLTDRGPASRGQENPDDSSFGPGNDRFDPLTGDNFRNWSDRLRDVEEMVDDPELRAEAARIRDRARGFRQDVRRHAREPNWDLVQLQVVRPLTELRNRVIEELLRRSSKEAMVPIDRDPVPPKYSERVQRYYERLGRGN